MPKKDDLNYRTAGDGVCIRTENLNFKFKQTHCIQIEKNTRQGHFKRGNNSRIRMAKLYLTSKLSSPFLFWKHMSLYSLETNMLFSEITEAQYYLSYLMYQLFS